MQVTNPNTTIKISNLSKKQSLYCGIPQQCLKSSKIIPNIDDPEKALIQLVKCLNDAGLDANIKGIQLSIILTVIKILQENDELKTNQKNELLQVILPEYCTAYSYSTYADFYVKVLKSDQYSQEKNLIKEEISNISLEKSYLKNFQDSQKLINILHIINALGRYIHTNSSYIKGNYSLIDYINERLMWDNDQKKFTGKYQRGQKKIPPPIYVEDLLYQFGCNCFCRTVLMGTLLKILASNGRLDLHPDQIYYVHQGGQQNCTDSHILLAILIDGHPNDLSNYLYVESTYDASTQSIEKNIINYLTFSIQTFLKSDTFHITNAPIDLIVISEYLNRNPLSFNVWLDYAPDLLEHEIFNNILIFSKRISETERFARIYTELSLYINSSTMWKQYIGMIASLPQLVPQLQNEMYKGILYQKQNAKQILVKYLDLKPGKDTQSIAQHYNSIIGHALQIWG